MPIYRNPIGGVFSSQSPVELHFHDQDETWLIQEGSCRAKMVAPDGREEVFELRAGDVWMIEAGTIHGCKPGPEGCRIFPFFGSIGEGSHKPGHYYVEKEGYVPTLVVNKAPVKRDAPSEDY